jgi:galactokinase
VNLIGEHTDYNGGHVFPCALTLGVCCAARPRGDRKLRLYSLNFPRDGVVETDIDARAPLPGGSWANYPLGVVRAFSDAGHAIPSGADMVFFGDIPAGAGLSSSAALEVLAGTALRALYDLPVTPVEIARLGQRAENTFVGVNCGIMDQFASAMGKADHAIFLDTASLDYALAPLHLGGAQLLLVNSGVKHSLASSAYNRRREECAQALSALQQALPVRSLGELSPAEFEAHAGLIADPVCRRRARHAVHENARTVEAFRALQVGDLAGFGRLMNASHVSLRDDYEVSCPETDALTEIAWSCPGVLGSRMTGGGFGGCTVSLIQTSKMDSIMETIRKNYKAQTGIDPDLFVTRPAQGAHIVQK